jgi:hypothetical protein
VSRFAFVSSFDGPAGGRRGCDSCLCRTTKRWLGSLKTYFFREGLPERVAGAFGRIAIAHLNGDKMTAAKLLGIGKTRLYRKLKQYSASSGLSI